MEKEISNEEAARQIELIARAVRSGSKLESRERGGREWREKNGLCFSVFQYEYRIKPQPKEFYAVMHKYLDGSTLADDRLFLCRRSADFEAQKFMDRFVIKLREVTE